MGFITPLVLGGAFVYFSTAHSRQHTVKQGVERTAKRTKIVGDFR